MKNLRLLVCLPVLVLSLAAQTAPTQKGTLTIQKTNTLKFSDGGGSCSIGNTGYCNACSVSCKPGQSANCVPGQLQCDVVYGCKCVVQSNCYCAGKSSVAETQARHQFGELQKKKAAGNLSDAENKELLGLSKKLGMVRQGSSQYCYCEENNYACNPDNPWPGCTCRCVNTDASKTPK
jgi:hypothetical protein